MELQLRYELAPQALLDFAEAQGPFSSSRWQVEEEQQGVAGVREDHLALRGEGWKLANESKAHRLQVALSPQQWNSFCRVVLKVRPAAAQALAVVQRLFWYQEVQALDSFRVHLKMLEPAPGAAEGLRAVRKAGRFPLLESLLLAAAGHTEAALARLPEDHPDLRARLLARTGRVDLTLPVTLQTRLLLLAQVGDWQAFLTALETGKPGPDATDRNLLQAHAWLHLGREKEARAALERAGARYPAYVRNWIANDCRQARHWLGDVPPHPDLAKISLARPMASPRMARMAGLPSPPPASAPAPPPNSDRPP